MVGQVISFDYTDRNGATTHRVITVEKAEKKGEFTMYTGRDAMRDGDYRWFRSDKMQNVKVGVA